MSCHPRVTEWATTLQTHLPHLSKPQVMVLAWWSLGMVLARSCALTAVSACLAPWFNGTENTLRQRLRECCYPAQAKRGNHRQAVVVETGFAPLLAWVLSRWEGTPLALALDATPLGDRFTVLVIRVVYRGCAIPIAWPVLTAKVEKAWRPEWLRRLRQLHRAVPATWTVIVLADRGRYARWLFLRMTRLGWHPLLRINNGGTCRPTGARQGVSLKTLVPQPGRQWSGTGVAFKSRPRRLACTLRARWEPGYPDPWFILTELPPTVSEVCWYGLRAWIEPGFKRTQRGGWQGQHTRMTHPDRAARRWLAIAVATLWLVSVGGEAEDTLAAATWPDLATRLPPPPRSWRATHRRWVSVFRRGWNLILAALLNQAPLPHGRWVPEPWPTRPPWDPQGTIPPVVELLQAA
jgi:hypothetical protein